MSKREFERHGGWGILHNVPAPSHRPKREKNNEAVVTKEFVEGFIEGAADVWGEVANQL